VIDQVNGQITPELNLRVGEVPYCAERRKLSAIIYNTDNPESGSLPINRNSLAVISKIVGLPAMSGFTEDSFVTNSALMVSRLRPISI
jgi:hypothetical protein